MASGRPQPGTARCSALFRKSPLGAASGCDARLFRLVPNRLPRWGTPAPLRRAQFGTTRNRAGLRGQRGQASSGETGGRRHCRGGGQPSEQGGRRMPASGAQGVCRRWRGWWPAGLAGPLSGTRRNARRNGGDGRPAAAAGTRRGPHLSARTVRDGAWGGRDGRGERPRTRGRGQGVGACVSEIAGGGRSVRGVTGGDRGRGCGWGRGGRGPTQARTQGRGRGWAGRARTRRACSPSGGGSGRSGGRGGWRAVHRPLPRLPPDRLVQPLGPVADARPDGLDVGRAVGDHGDTAAGAAPSRSATRRA